jgi:hypothetical protein
LEKRILGINERSDHRVSLRWTGAVFLINAEELINNLALFFAQGRVSQSGERAKAIVGFTKKRGPNLRGLFSVMLDARRSESDS